jgi:hypothetical protein
LRLPESEAESRGAAAAGSIWQFKPWWCQPWSILLSGLLVVVASWLVLQLWWLTAGVALLVLAWWGLFLLLLPAAWKADQLRETDS